MYRSLMVELLNMRNQVGVGREESLVYHLQSVRLTRCDGN